MAAVIGVGFVRAARTHLMTVVTAMTRLSDRLVVRNGLRLTLAQRLGRGVVVTHVSRGLVFYWAVPFMLVLCVHQN